MKSGLQPYPWYPLDETLAEDRTMGEKELKARKVNGVKA